MSDNSIRVDISSPELDKASRLLAGIADGYSRAINSAIQRTTSAAMTFAAANIPKHYRITTAKVRRYARDRRYVGKKAALSGGGPALPTAELTYFGSPIPLVAFSPSESSAGRPKVSVYASSPQVPFEHALFARVKAGQSGMHSGIFERKDRTPGTENRAIRQLYGPSIPQMINANRDVRDAMVADVLNVFAVRVEHETERLLNGWGV